MRVLVVGGAGYIGSHTVYELIRDGQSVVVVDNLSSGYRHLVHRDAAFYEADIRDQGALERIFTREKIDLVMHFAAKIVVPESISDPLEYYSNNVEGLRVLLSVMRDHGVKRIVFSSTAAVYGEANGTCHEEGKTEPINPYGETKLACERMIEWTARAHGMSYCIFRYFNVAGADRSLEIGSVKEQLTHLIPVAIRAALTKDERLVIYGNDYDTKDGTCIRDYIHVTDLAIAHVKGAHHLLAEKPSAIMNLGSGSGYSVLEVARAIAGIIELDYAFGPRREGDPAVLIASNDRAKAILGWEPKRTLADMIRSELAFRRTQTTAKS
ncbi:MAG: UDP-glucose 4-epimerase GalE [Acholeplasmataceae bacterium]